MGAPEDMPSLPCELLRTGTQHPQGIFVHVVRGTAQKGNAAFCTMYLSKVIAEVRVDFGFASYNIDPSSILLSFQRNVAGGWVGVLSLLNMLIIRKERADERS